jgi:hypothetical protein
MRRNIQDWAAQFHGEIQHWNNRHLHVLQGNQVNDVPPTLSSEFLAQYRSQYMPYVFKDHYLNDPRPRPDVPPQYTTTQTYTQQQPFSPHEYSPQQQQHNLFPDSHYNTPQQQQQTLFPDPPSYTPPSCTQPFNESDFLTTMPQMRNFFDHDNFQSPGTHRFYENYANVYYPNQSTHPQPTQQIPQDFSGNNYQTIF